MKWRIEPATQVAERMGNLPTWYVYLDDDTYMAVVWRHPNREFGVKFHRQTTELQLKYLGIFFSMLRNVDILENLLVEVTEDNGC